MIKHIPFTEADEKVELLDETEDTVAKYDDPFLLKTILLGIKGSDYPRDLESVNHRVGTDEKSLEKAIEFLKKEKLLETEKGDHSVITEKGNIYAYSSRCLSFGFAHFWKNLTNDEAHTMIKAVEPLVRFNYHKILYVPLGTIETIMEEGVRELNKKGDDYVRKLLNLPEAVGPSFDFVKYVYSRENSLRRHITIPYGSLEDAFEDDASISAHIKQNDVKPFRSIRSKYNSSNSNLSCYEDEDGGRTMHISAHWGLDDDRNPLSLQRTNFALKQEFINRVKDLYPEKKQVR